MSDEREALGSDEPEREAPPDREPMSNVTATDEGPDDMESPPMTQTPPINEDQPPTV